MALLQLEKDRLVWRARQVTGPDQRRQSSFYSTLDAHLQGGWPQTGLVELACGLAGIGELRLLFPLLAQSQARLQVWINPPAQLNGQALAQHGINLSKTLLIRCQNPQHALWSAQQSLNSGCCSHLVLWAKNLTSPQAKRLQVAAKDNQALMFWLHPQPEPSTSALPVSARFSLAPLATGLRLKIHKYQGQWPQHPCQVDMHKLWPSLAMPTVTTAPVPALKRNIKLVSLNSHKLQ
ncbi:translesion DNA synthesis-associated protein ImuA [Candidatus Njordibacter sp. Uisw_002]|jgi:cell division inhibitor SulA|uniref:translesion DNA synthesis-associated protein ImuA n=1 Tax=Candidatus Njordibacter sp. Uisw_002 TaxID=3230971 RepID=UPI003D4F35BB|tara:strand:+ start:4612 stop:5319 length:708 start_codon:yes stop_codon:yes gene_type:complete